MFKVVIYVMNLGLPEQSKIRLFNGGNLCATGGRVSFKGVQKR